MLFANWILSIQMVCLDRQAILIALNLAFGYNSKAMQMYRSGHNEAHSKCVCWETGTKVRILSSAPKIRTVRLVWLFLLVVIK